MKYIMVFLLVILFSVNVYGYDADELPDIDKVESAVRDNTDLSFKKLIRAVISGEDIISLLKNDLRSFVKKRIYDNGPNIKNIIAVAIICSILNILSQDIKDSSTAELIGLTGRVVILVLASAGIKASIDILLDCTEAVADIINSAIPLIMTVASVGGKIPGGGLLLAMGTEIAANGIKTVVIPLLLMGTMLRLVNMISGREILDRLSELFIGFVSWALKLCAYGFVFLMGLERISGGTISKGAGSMIKSAVKMIPVVGDIVGGAGEIAATAILTIGNAAGIALIIIIIIMSSFPIIEIGVVAIMYRLAAAILEPVCDKATIAVIDAVGEANFKVLAALFTINAMFIMSLAILMCYGR